ncbi:MAG: hypothetical protein ABSG73_08795 [Candidatus Aminicenantales bacterium]|jgi:hypothetical protein
MKNGKKYLVPGLLAACILTSVVMAVFKPVPHGYRYSYAVVLSLALGAIWLLSRARPDLVLGKAFLTAVFITGLFFMGSECLLVRNKPRPEIVEYYKSVFQALEAGQNPYTCGTIFHRTEFLKPVYGNFNYPPLEIYPYYLAYRLAGTWTSSVMAAVNIVLQSLACLVLLWTFPEVKRKYLLPFFPLFIFLEIHLDIALTLLVTALILRVVVRDRERPRPAARYLIAALFGAGLMTKFLIMPLMAAYYGHQVDWKKPKTLGRIAVDVSIALGVALLIMAPFGVAAVFRNTIAFNLILKDRAVLTTFFPNVLSGPFSWAGLEGLYPFAAVIILALSVLAAPRLRLFPALLAVASTFLFVAPVPERQYIPVVLYIVIVGIFLDLREGRPDVLRRAEPGLRRPAPASTPAARGG